MSAVKDVAEALELALKGVAGLRAYRDPGASVDPPGAVLGPPSLVWGGYCSGPVSATFLVYVLEKADGRALERLWDWVPLVSAAIDSVPDAVVIRADPGVYNSGGTDLPTYELTVEVSIR